MRHAGDSHFLLSEPRHNWSPFRC